MHDVKKILIIETAFIGDAVLSLALAEEIRRHRPDIEIHYLVAPASASILTYSPSVTKAHSFDKRGADGGEAGISNVANRLNTENFDAIISIHESHRTAKLVSLLRVKYKIGTSSAKALLPYLTHSYQTPNVGRRTERILELARFFSDDINYSTLPKLQFSDTLIPSDIQEQNNIVVFAPGSAWKTKKWSIQKFVEVGKALVNIGNTIVIIGSHDDMTESKEITVGIGARVIDCAGSVPLPVAGAIISRAKLVIGNDSAPIHIATACRVRSVEIMGPTVQEFGFVPPPELGIVIEQEGLWCRPCNSHGGDVCPTYGHECMNGISSQKVIIATKQLLEHAVS